MKIKKILILLLTVFCVFFIIALSGCILNSDSIYAVRNKAKTLSNEMAETMIEAFKNKDSSAVKSLLCQKSQELKDIDGQIENSFDFMEGTIESYKISPTSYEGYSSEYGVVVQYSFGCDVYITANTGRFYRLYLYVNYIELDSSIEGMASYTISEYDREENESCTAGHSWASPYDDKCGFISAKLITAATEKDTDAVKNLLCEKTLERTETDNEIQTVFQSFTGTPLFSEREDGLYSGQSENDFTCQILAYDIERSDDGTIEGIWVSVAVKNVLTNAGKNYNIRFVAYLQYDNNPQIVGISYFSIEDGDTGEKNSVGEWIHK